MLLSFIIPCYHTPKEMLFRCLDSLLPLTYCTWEALVIDDGNEQDEVTTWVRSRYDERFRVIRQANMGLSGARNTGMDQAKGDYIVFVDADDELYTETFSTLIPEIEKLEYDFICYRYQKVTTPLFKGDATDFMSKYDISPSACTYAIKSSVVSRLRFTPGIYHEDEEFCTLLHLNSQNILVTPIVAYHYIYNPKSIVHEHNWDKIRKRHEDLVGIIERLQNMEVLAAKKKALERRIHVLAMCYIANVMQCQPSFQDTKTLINPLKQIGLYPLPDYQGIKRYRFIRRLTTTPLMIWLISKVIAQH